MGAAHMILTRSSRETAKLLITVATSDRPVPTLSGQMVRLKPDV